MNTNSIILQNIDQEGLRSLIGEVVTERLESFKPKPVTNELLITRLETARKLRVSLPTLNELTKKGAIKAYRIGGRVLYKSNEVEASLMEVIASKYRR
jgi:excisionase family DNA binding protein